MAQKENNKKWRQDKFIYTIQKLTVSQKRLLRELTQKWPISRCTTKPMKTAFWVSDKNTGKNKTKWLKNQLSKK